MSDYYLAKRTKNLFDPESQFPFRLSRSKLDLFLNCPRCFYVDRRLGVGQPPGFPFNLNSAVDHLLKKEFDAHRANKTPHPLMAHYGIDAVPFAHASLDTWRENFKGAEFLDTQTNLMLTGAVDDIWQNNQGELIIVDYKSTAKDGEVNLDAEWQISYKRQMEIYQWLFQQNGFTVSRTGYFVYCNGKRDKAAFDAKLEFDIKLIPYTGDNSWVATALQRAKLCLMGKLPNANSSCDYCRYLGAVAEVVGEQQVAILSEVKPEIKRSKIKNKPVAESAPMF